MDIIRRLLGAGSSLRDAEGAFATGELNRGMALLSGAETGPLSEHLAEAERLVVAGDITSAAEFLLSLDKDYRQNNYYLVPRNALGDAAFKRGWLEAIPWLPPRVLHFTELANLPSILTEMRLLSRFQLELHGLTPPNPGGDMRSWHRDSQQGLLDYVHLSLTTPHPMLFHAASRIRRPVYLALSPFVSLRKDARYSDRNATDAGAIISQELPDLRQIIQRALSGVHPAQNKSAIQAEILIRQGITLSPHILQGILFRSRYEMESALRQCRPEGWLADRFQVDTEVFG